MLHLYFVRHGQTDWNVDRRFQGQQDVPLNALGRCQAAAAAERLKGVRFDAAYTSDLCRARETAEVLNAHHGLPLVAVRELRERAFGCFEGYTFEQTRERFPEERRAYERDKLNYTLPGGESRLDFIRRVGAWLEELARRHPAGTVLLVAHGGVLGAAFSHLISHKLGFDPPRFVPLFSVQNGSISQLQRREDGWLAVSLNETAHLDGLSEPPFRDEY